jgi:hypothetical protein
MLEFNVFKYYFEHNENFVHFFVKTVCIDYNRFPGPHGCGGFSEFKPVASNYNKYEAYSPDLSFRLDCSMLQ